MASHRAAWFLVVLMAPALSCFQGGAAVVETPAHAAAAAPAVDAQQAGIAALLGRWDTSLTPAERLEVAATIATEAERVGLQLDLVLGVILVESGGDAFAVSHAGALGLMQLRPATAAAVAGDAGVAWHGEAQLFDPVVNVRLGVAYLARLLDRFGEVDLALAAYNWGPTRLGAKLRRGDPLPVAYASRVLAAARLGEVSEVSI